MIKQRYWMVVCYPESMPSDAFQKLHSLMVPLAISPLHEFDIDDKTGELKKPHYHILICYPGPTTYKAVLENVCSILNVNTCKPCVSLKASYEYLFHKNERDKHLYDESLVQFYHGLSAKEVDKLNFESTLFSQMIHIIDSNNPCNFHQLVRLISKTNNMDMIHYLMSYSFFWKNYIDH